MISYRNTADYYGVICSSPFQTLADSLSYENIHTYIHVIKDREEEGINYGLIIYPKKHGGQIRGGQTLCCHYYYISACKGSHSEAEELSV